VSAAIRTIPNLVAPARWLYQELGNIPTIVYLTRGERGIQGRPNDDAARSAALSANRLVRYWGKSALRVRLTVHSSLERVDELQKILAEEHPDVVLLIGRWTHTWITR
jgi:LmbE family N-acetylglucosaminyl deacetylase